jgi:MFS family permease
MPSCTTTQLLFRSPSRRRTYVFAFLFGSAAALDAPVRQTFVAQLVGDEHLHNAVALNSTSFNTGRMVGPAVAGLVIAKVGTGWAFAINGLSFAAVLNFEVTVPRVQTLSKHESST